MATKKTKKTTKPQEPTTTTDTDAPEVKKERVKRIQKTEQTIDVAGTSITVPIYVVEKDGQQMIFGSYKEASTFLKSNRTSSLVRRLTTMRDRLVKSRDEDSASYRNLSKAQCYEFEQVLNSIESFLTVSASTTDE